MDKSRQGKDKDEGKMEGDKMNKRSERMQRGGRSRCMVTQILLPGKAMWVGGWGLLTAALGPQRRMETHLTRSSPGVTAGSRQEPRHRKM